MSLAIKSWLTYMLVEVENHHELCHWGTSNAEADKELLSCDWTTSHGGIRKEQEPKNSKDLPKMYLKMAQEFTQGPSTAK